MIKNIKRLVFPISILLVMGFTLFIVNQISGIYLLVRSYSEFYANILLVLLIAASVVLMAWPFIIYLKMPKAIQLPESQAQLLKHQQRLIKRLKHNKLLKKADLIPYDPKSLEKTIQHLDHEATKVIRKTSNIVFLTTSVSQNGKLDALTLLATQSKMVWKIAHIYYQRPTLRELTYLYANVGASSMLASEIEDLDITTQIEPVLQSFFRNSAGKSIPVIGPTANIIFDSLLEGSTNAFLTLRVGNIAKKYCGCNEVTSKNAIRKNAFKESVSQLKEIVLKSSSQIVTGLLKATRKAGVDTIKSGWEGLRSAGGKVIGGISETGRRANPFKKKSLK